MARDGARTLQIDGVSYRWRVGARREGSALTLTLIVEPAGQRGCRLTATFRGHFVAFLFGGDEQDLVIGPGVVRRAVAVARARGWPDEPRHVVLDPAEPAQLGASLGELDVADAELRAACEQWFVPYPGRAALAEAWREVAGDVAAMVARFPGTRAAQIEAWLRHLGIGG